MRRTGLLLARILLAAFCWVTSTYAFVASSAFAYLQFIKPRVFHWVGLFSDWHPELFWVWFALLVASLAADTDRRDARRMPTLGLVLCAALVGVWNSRFPVLASLSDGPRSLAIGMAALVPLLWFALIDHLAGLDWLLAPRAAPSETDRRAAEGRLLAAAMASALFVAVLYAAMAAVGISRAFEPDLMAAGLALAVGTSLVDHLLVFVGAFLALSLIARVLGARFVWHYLALLLVVTGGCAAAFVSLVGGALGLGGPGIWMAALATGLSIAGTWGGSRVRRLAGTRESLGSALDVLALPPKGAQMSGRAIAAVAALLPLAALLVALASRMDWDFVLLNSGVLLVWVTTFVTMCRATPPRPGIGNWTIGITCAVPLLAHAGFAVSPATAHVLDRYAVHNASFRLADNAIRPRSYAPSFDRYLRANTGLTDVAVSPMSIDLMPSLAPTTGARPAVFLIVVDSLRPDYLSPYNKAVHFTPRIAEFAARNILFTNAFTRYGGTGLSMPAIWAGSALAHKQYVLPFASMNALEKVLDVNGYRRIMSRDHITTALWTAHPSDVELDRGRPEMDYDLCRTLDELGETLRSDVPAGVPVFAQTRSLNLHVAAVRNGYVPPGKTYPGFEAPYAWRVERMDACFGQFIDRLQRLKLYDRSLVVLTADHGELIGEDGRWGHSYHMFPEVIQTPLLMHLPDSMRGGAVDRQALSLSTDITPTIYEALGYRPVQANDLMGQSLVDVEDQASTGRRGQSYVLAASYGAVYAVVSRNGRHLYIADAIKGADLAYRRNADGAWAEWPVSAGLRAVGHRRIRRHVDEIARLYHLDQRF